MQPAETSAASAETAAAAIEIAVTLTKPPPKKWPSRRRRRSFIGLSWEVSLAEKPLIGVKTKRTFIGMPSCGTLVGGDVVLRVQDLPVANDEDVVYHWERAAAGPVRFHVLRTETHRLSLSAAALRELEVTWSDQHAPLPVVSATNATDAWLRVVQTPAVPQAGDLLLSIGGASCATAEEARALLQAVRRRVVDGDASRGAPAAVDISLMRGFPLPILGEKGTECLCCPWLSTVTPLRQPRRRGGGGGSASSSTMAETLLEEVSNGGGSDPRSSITALAEMDA